MNIDTKIPQDQINEEIGNLHENKFRVMMIKMIQELGNRMEKTKETFNKDLEERQSKQRVMNNTITEIKNTLEGISNIKTEAEEQISELKDKMVEILPGCRTKKKE